MKCVTDLAPLFQFMIPPPTITPVERHRFYIRHFCHGNVLAKNDKKKRNLCNFFIVSKS